MSKYEEISAFARRLTTTRLECGETIRELTNYQDLSLWWFGHFDFLLFLLTLPEDKAGNIPKGLKFQSFVSRLPKFFFTGLNFFFDLSRKLLIKFFLCIYKQTEPQGGKAKILFSSRDLTWRRLEDHKAGKEAKTDVFFHSLIEMLGDTGKIAFLGTYPFIKYVYPFGSVVQSFSVMLDKVKSRNFPYRPFNLYWSFDIARKEFTASRHFASIWKKLKADSEFRRLCVLDGRDLFDLIRRKMRFYFLILFPYVVKRIEISKRLLEKEKPNLILLVNEYGIFERSLLIAGKDKGIPIVAIQHGNISEFSNGYIFAKNEISPEGSVRSPYCPIPDKTLVFGPHYKTILTESSAYPEDSVVVTGSPAFDVLNTIKRRCSRADILKEYGIDPDKKVILWTTQCLVLSDEENLNNMGAVRDAADSREDIVMVIKQHPREEKKHTEMLRSYLGADRKKIVFVPKNADARYLIYVCDVMITKFSTTATEALALDKPVIILNLGGEPDLIKYVDDGAAIGVYKSEGLGAAITKLLDDDAELVEKRKRYVHQHLYKNDGKATQRAAEVIRQMLGL